MRYAALIFFLVSLALTTFSQGRRYRLVGLTAGAWVETPPPYFSSYSVDLNLTWIMFQTPINRVLDFKGTAIGKIRYGDDPELVTAGVQIVIPRYFEAKERFSEKSTGWYLGPAVGASRDFRQNLYNCIGALEFGRYFSSDRMIAFTFNLQAGAAYQFRLNRTNQWTPFLGFNLGLGIWAKQQVNIRGGSI